MHHAALRRVIEIAFPVATVRSIALPAPRVGTEADILYNLSPAAQMGDSQKPPAQVDVSKLPEVLGVTLSSFDPSSLPFYSTGSLMGDCTAYCTIGYDPTTPDRRPLPLMAPRLSPRRMCLDAVVMLPGYEAKDLRRVVLVNFLKHLPRLDGEESFKSKEPSYVTQRKARDVRGYEDYGIRVLSDCIELVVDCEPSREADRCAGTSRTMFVGFANPSWSLLGLNRTHDENERSARRVFMGVSRETLRRALPLPIIEASRLLANFSKNACGGTGLELPPLFWLNAAIVTACAKTSQVNPVLAEEVLLSLGADMPPQRCMWEQDGYNRQFAWELLKNKRPMSSCGASFHFNLVTDINKNNIIAASLAQTVLRFLRSKAFDTLGSILPQETFHHPVYRSAIRHVLGVAQQRPPNFLSSISSN